MPTLDDHDERLQQHAERMRLLEDVMMRDRAHRAGGATGAAPGW